MTKTNLPHPEWRLWWGTVNLVIAAYGIEPEQFRQGLGNIQRYGSPTKRSWEQHHSWTSAAFKTYGSIPSPELDEKLQKLGCFCLRIHLKSSLSWTLVAFAQGQRLLTECHDFSLLHPRQRDSAYIATLAKAYEGQWDAYVEDVELNLPTELQEQGRSLPFTVAHLQCLDWYQQTCVAQAERLWSVFQGVGVGCDRQELSDILVGKLCSVPELEWYVGNLPRFLTAIGLSEVFWDWQTELRTT